MKQEWNNKKQVKLSGFVRVIDFLNEDEFSNMKLKDQIKSISILKLEDNSIFLVINSDITQDMISDLKILNLENYKRSEKNTLSKFLPEVEIKKYTVIIYRGASDNNYLENLEILETSINPKFDKT